MIGREYAEGIAVQRILRRVEDILEDAREREEQGLRLALDVDARFRLEDEAAVQFQVASAVLEETRGFNQEEVVAELLSIGLNAVLSGAARAVGGGRSPDLPDMPLMDGECDCEPIDSVPTLAYVGRERVLN